MVHNPTSDDAGPSSEDDGVPPESTGNPAAVLAARIAIVAAFAAGAFFYLAGFPGLRPLGFQYHIDLDVYRLGGAAFAAGDALYGPMPPTFHGSHLPFTYPPLAAVVFAPMSWIPLDAAGVILTVLSIAALVATLTLVLAAIGVGPRTTLAWTALAGAAAAFTLEPVRSTFDYGQVNILLMMFVAADCLLRKPPWPRGLLIGFVAAVKLTPAVFILFFLLRKDVRAAVTTGLSFVLFGAIGFLLTRADSWEYWTDTLFDSSRIGGPAYAANQSITGVLARLGLDPSMRTVLWLALSVAVLALAAVAMHRAFTAGRPLVALFVNALFGLLVSPVSWSHHWVWVAPLLLALGVAAYRRRNVALGAAVASSWLMFAVAPHWVLAAGRSEGTGWPLWDQFLASSYVWWALAVIVAVVVSLGRRGRPAGRNVGSTAQLSPTV